MTGTSRALKRLGVAGLGAALMTAGLVPFAAGAMAAAATTVTLSPSPGAQPPGTCVAYTATVTPAGSDTTVTLSQPNNNGVAPQPLTIGFCDPTNATVGTGAGTTNNSNLATAPTAGNANTTVAGQSCSAPVNTTAVCQKPFTDGNTDGTIIFGVTSNQQGTMAITATATNGNATVQQVFGPTAYPQTGGNATAIGINPPSDTANTGVCNPYTVTVAPKGSSFTAQIAQTSSDTTAPLNIGFCQPTGTPSESAPTGTAASPSSNNALNGGTTTVTNDNCQTPAAANANSTTTASCEATYTDSQDANGTAGGDGQVVIGVTSDHAGTMTIVVFADTNGNGTADTGEKSATASKTWTASSTTGTNANNNKLTCQPPNVKRPTGTTATYTCTLTDASGNPIANAGNLFYRVESGPDATGVNSSGTCSTTGDGANGTAGESTCIVQNGGQPGHDVIDVWENTNAIATQQNEEPATQVTADFVTAAPVGSQVTVTCSPNQTSATGTAPNQGATCQDPTSDKTETFTATVVNGTPAQPQNGVLVEWTIPNNGNNGGGTGEPANEAETLSDSSCVTDANGQCSVTLTNPTPTEGEAITVQATLQRQGNTSQSAQATKVWHNPTAAEARNISVAPPQQNAPSGGTADVTAAVVDRFGNPVNGVVVAWSESGPGAFRNGNGTNGNAAQCTTDATGKCTVEVISLDTEKGDETITASIAPNAPGNNNATIECNAPADKTNYDPTGYNASAATTSKDAGDPTGSSYDQPATGAPAGNCTSAPATVSWGGTANPPSRERPHIDTPNDGAVRLGAHHITVSGTAAPGHTVRLFKNGDAKGTVDVGSDGRFSFSPFINRRLNLVVKDLTNGLASSTVTVYDKIAVALKCHSPRAGKLVCHLNTSPNQPKTTVDYTYSNNRDGSKGTKAGETSRHGNDKLVVKGLTRGHYQVKAVVHGGHHRRHGAGADETHVG